MLLSKVFKNINPKYKLIKFKDIRFNSKECKFNDIFFAISGNNVNGKNYINEAIKNGAKIIISNLNFEGFNKDNILFIHSKDPRKKLAEVANNLYFKKPKNIIAVTGTNGKTSISNFYYQILTLNKKKVASIGTLGISSKNLNIKTSNTTIDQIKIHKILQKLNEQNVNNVILEASSHGLKQNRLSGITFKTCIFTNLSRDHLDYHKTFKDYFNSKLILFKKLLKNKGNIIFDDKIEQAKQLNKVSKNKKLKKYCFGYNNSFISFQNIKKTNNKKQVEFLFNKKKYSFETELIGEVQIKNLLFAILAAYLSKIKIKSILKTINKVKPVPGRLEKIGKIKNNSKVILDYAHTPDALKTVILNIKNEYPLSKISLVFGCGGNRDKEKRSAMGMIASRYCDKIYLTDDNPRLENPESIRKQTKKKIDKKKLKEIPSRAKAIFIAIKELNSGNILIVSGKGHETYQEYVSRKSFSDKYEILKAINKKNEILSNSIKTNILNETLKNKILKKNILINSASLNSKKIKKNSIFIGAKGRKFNGNLFANEAYKNGAILSISNKKFKNSKILFNKHPLRLFSILSSIYRKSLDANNIAITGSAGKTSVKELTGFCLSKLSKTFISKKSFNNKFGVPLSIFNTPEKINYVVLEVGMDKKGEIDNLTKIINPDLGLITNISYAHIENFKNMNHIARAKGEIINNIIPGGTLVINKDDKYYNYFNNKAKKQKLNVISYSLKNKQANIFFISEKKINNKYLINLKINNKNRSFYISRDLISFKQNILATLSIISNYFDVEKLNKNLFLKFTIPKSRGSIIMHKKASKKLNIIDESYNSNPLSLKFALEKFDNIYKEKNNKYLLIGDMLELGKYSKKLHIQIAKHINKSKVNRVYTYGKLTKYTFNKLKPQIRGKMLKTDMEVANLINKDLPNNSYLMIKGSNSTGLNKIIQNL